MVLGRVSIEVNDSKRMQRQSSVFLLHKSAPRFRPNLLVGSPRRTLLRARTLRKKHEYGQCRLCKKTPLDTRGATKQQQTESAAYKAGVALLVYIW